MKRKYSEFSEPYREESSHPYFGRLLFYALGFPLPKQVIIMRIHPKRVRFIIACLFVRGRLRYAVAEQGETEGEKK